MKWIAYTTCLIGFCSFQPIWAELPVTLSGPSPAIPSYLNPGTSNTYTFTVTNNVPKWLPIAVSGLSGPVTRTAVANDCSLSGGAYQDDQRVI